MFKNFWAIQGAQDRSCEEGVHRVLFPALRLRYILVSTPGLAPVEVEDSPQELKILACRENKTHGAPDDRYHMEIP